MTFLCLDKIYSDLINTLLCQLAMKHESGPYNLQAMNQMKPAFGGHFGSHHNVIKNGLYKGKYNLLSMTPKI